MTMDPHNYKHVTTTCPECKHDEILMDPEQEIIYCTYCGLVLEENTIFSIVKYLENEEEKIKHLRGLWRK